MTTTNPAEQAIRDLIKARQKLDEYKAKYEELEERVKGYLNGATVKTVNIDGHTVSLVESNRRSFDVQALKDLVSASVFRKVTEPAVKTSLFDAAVKLGNIDEEIIEQVVSVTPYTQLRVK